MTINLRFPQNVRFIWPVDNCRNFLSTRVVKFQLCLSRMLGKKVKQSNYRPGQALRVPAGWGSQISRQSAHEGGKVVSPTHCPPLPPESIPGTHFCYRLSRPQGHSATGIPIAPSGIEPATFRLVVQCLNQLRYGVPLRMLGRCEIMYNPKIWMKLVWL